MSDGGTTKFNTGILPSQTLRALVAEGAITASEPILDDQVQPASVDLRLGPVAYRVRASFLPGRHATVKERLDAVEMHAIDLSKGAVFERHCVYIVPLLESVRLTPGLSALANPKSSTGRLDVFARLITDHGTEFDRVEAGYAGPLYAEISPRAFSVRVHTGTRLLQLRLRRGEPSHDDTSLRALHQAVGLNDTAPDQANIKGGIAFTVDIRGDENGLVGYRARRHAGLIDLDRIDYYDPLDFWEPIHRRGRSGIILDPNDFYILASKESVVVPADHAAEMLAYDSLVGEFRVHYAGFFDPGFGLGETGGAGSRAVLEVRAHEVPFLIEDGQVVGRLVYERLTERPDKLYGQGIGSNYQSQGLRLGKQFRRI
ncbi:2'-deoxycytidine 5'-triphosphate deaminase [Aliidongia dinghuensis]|uniref:2'-deoxycytidine 5'-triphosphate deaminase n=1 Tax=Aliidongia dinghuensis TaxID=1867774 RepID=A0A8J2YY92_9PROT|nr:2'-deoxycytidine 5'-triphosphate deaminase [Aliidongia dinghuensis]GGF35147.1 2'-deoxycytidine 5'-triphosphate deaminase [Aliidongia dinghuensis]